MFSLVQMVLLLSVNTFLKSEIKLFIIKRHSFNVISLSTNTILDIISRNLTTSPRGLKLIFLHDWQRKSTEMRTFALTTAKEDLKLDVRIMLIRDYLKLSMGQIHRMEHQSIEGKCLNISII